MSEARFLELAARDGMETLRVHVAHCGYNFEGYGCTCKWLPLPEPERLGALAGIADANMMCSWVVAAWMSNKASRDWRGLTEALLASKEGRDVQPLSQYIELATQRLAQAPRF